MALMSRMIRLCKADAHGVMDQFEDKGLMLKQCLRDMEQALEQKRSRYNHLMLSRESLAQELDSCRKECEELEEDLRLALEKDKEQIAKMLVRKLKPKEEHQKAALRHMEMLDRDMEQLKKVIQEQEVQLDQLKMKSKTYLYEQEREKSCLDSPSSADNRYELTEEEVELELIRRKNAMERSREAKK